MDLKNTRINYTKNEINYNDIYDNPFEFFVEWINEAFLNNCLEPNSFVLSTIEDNIPTSRVVLLKNIDHDGFVFYTNYDSSKSKHILINNNVSLNFFWPELEKQVRVIGAAYKINDNVSDEYFASRPKESQLGAILSEQSKKIDFNYDFNSKLIMLQEKYKNKDIKRPLNWGGFKVIPTKIEFWQGRPSRLHDRLLYKFKEGKWDKSRLSP
ncbi:MAG: pyridoxamine 5'-phosphate oxidase [Flavobacteriales bacterium]|nr:pyridoxamine 5'-phosphate oxidase [Flavobacteriales bacterium]|tara:strand:+ start:9714 stop:10346 length:633 start_codon:yes stop_codon:yes gene_type:complete